MVADVDVTTHFVIFLYSYNRIGVKHAHAVAKNGSSTFCQGIPNIKGETNSIKKYFNLGGMQKNHAYHQVVDKDEGNKLLSLFISVSPSPVCKLARCFLCFT